MSCNSLTYTLKCQALQPGICHAIASHTFPKQKFVNLQSLQGSNRVQAHLATSHYGVRPNQQSYYKGAAAQAARM